MTFHFWLCLVPVKNLFFFLTGFSFASNQGHPNLPLFQERLDVRRVQGPQVLLHVSEGEQIPLLHIHGLVKEEHLGGGGVRVTRKKPRQNHQRGSAHPNQRERERERKV